MIIKNNFTTRGFGNDTNSDYKPIGKGSNNEDKKFEDRQAHKVDMYSIDPNNRGNDNTSRMDDGWKFFKDNTRNN